VRRYRELLEIILADKGTEADNNEVWVYERESYRLATRTADQIEWLAQVIEGRGGNLNSTIWKSVVADGAQQPPTIIIQSYAMRRVWMQVSTASVTCRSKSS
jgi:hypothetical protein